MFLERIYNGINDIEPIFCVPGRTLAGDMAHLLQRQPVDSRYKSVRCNQDRDPRSKASMRPGEVILRKR
jgi:hypothetical protein